jgi:hypothetical protein
MDAKIVQRSVATKRCNRVAYFSATRGLAAARGVAVHGYVNGSRGFGPPMSAAIRTFSNQGF